MADLRLDVVSEDKASGAMRSVGASTRDMADETAKATEKWRLFGDVARKAFEKVVEFAKEASKAYEEQAKADNLLALAAGKSTEALKKQAEVIEKSTGIDAVKTERMQALLMRFGEAPDKIDATVRALHDYATITGGDALSAAEALTASVSGGRAAFKELGLTYDTTGTKSEQLVAATAALAAKVGGASATDASSAAGQARIAAAAFEDLQKQLVAVFKSAGTGTGLIGSLTEALRGMHTALGGDSQVERNKARVGLQDELMGVQAYTSRYRKADQGGKKTMWDEYLMAREGFPGAQSPEQVLAREKEIRAALAKLDEEGAAQFGPLASTNPNDGATKKNAEGAAKSAADAQKEREAAAKAAQAAWQARSDEIRKRETAATEKFNSEELDRVTKEAKDAAKVKADAAEKAAKDAERAAADMAKRAADAAAAEQEQMRQAGEALGVAFVGGLSTQLAKLAGGGEFDMAEFLISLLPVLGGIAGTALGGPAGTALGGALGGGAAAILTAAKGRKMHDGGWVGDLPRYHNGTWAGDEHAAILQAGERVLSKREVSAMGGRQGVDGAARGGGSVSVTVNTLDGSTASEFYRRQGGRALFNALRTGGGNLQPVFGGG